MGGRAVTAVRNLKTIRENTKCRGLDAMGEFFWEKKRKSGLIGLD